MRIATWNVNSINVRLEALLSWLVESKIDIALLQELKCQNEAFPKDAIEDLGYNLAINGQKTYNGVAILSKYPIDEYKTDFTNDPDPSHARYIEAVISGPAKKCMRVASIYVPNGGDVGSDKFVYKLKFLDAFVEYLKELNSQEEFLVIGGDYNVAPEAIDVYDPKNLDGTTCFNLQERIRYRNLLNCGLIDAFRAMHPHKQLFSWWDYRGQSFKYNKGMRIDHLLLSPEAGDSLIYSDINSDLRAIEKSSDHVPVIADFEICS